MRDTALAIASPLAKPYHHSLCPAERREGLGSLQPEKGFAMKVEIEGGRLRYRFDYCGVECVEDTHLAPTPENIRLAQETARQISTDLAAGRFNYASHFSDKHIKPVATEPPAKSAECPSFEAFANLWYKERCVEWRRSYASTIRLTLDKYLIPKFGPCHVDEIGKDAILDFRAEVAKMPGLGDRETLSACRINKIMQPLRMILIEASDRYKFETTWRNIRSVPVVREDVHPLSLAEAELFLQTVRSDMRRYFEFRFLTGLRTSEVHGLRWASVNLEAGLIHVREAWVNGKRLPCKNNSSNRVVQLCSRATLSLREQFAQSEGGQIVFPSKYGRPINNNWMTDHVWYPTLQQIGLEARRPYQTRHTAATLWLSSGENPEWIARQLGHTTCEMLFRVYSRYVPNAVKRDGSSFERYLENAVDASCLQS